MLFWGIERRIEFEDRSKDDFLEQVQEASNFNKKIAAIDEWKYVDMLFQLTESELKDQNLLFDADKSYDDRYPSYLFFTIELSEPTYNRTKLSQITREVNKVFAVPAMILFKYHESLTLAIIDRQPHKRDEAKDVLRKVTLIKDINFAKPHRAHVDNLSELSLASLQGSFSINSFDELHKAWQKRLDVELVTNKFFSEYKKVFESVEAIVEQTITDVETARLFTQRLFNRLMFIYFIQKKGWMTFEGDSNYLRRIFETSKANGEVFYRDRLFWVFFYGLSRAAQSIKPRDNVWLEERRGLTPNLNGGLFEMEKDGLDDQGRVEIPDSCFESILSLFEHYNFTVEESTPLEVQVAIDPEILGRVFEELVTGRHESGSYYTPRQIVSFMCRESLKYFLAPHDSAETIAKFVDDGNGEDLRNPEQIFTALKTIRVCDPACGSGAYLLGMMQELLRLRESLFTAKQIDDVSHYKRKRDIIEHNIYGVDIDKFAVQIASLRFWLSLAIESATPQGLPNLKYKIGCGDSLLAPLENDPQPDLQRGDLITQFRLLKAQYVEAFDHVAKTEIETQIERLRVNIARTMHHLPELTSPARLNFARTGVEPLKIKVGDAVKRGDKASAEINQKKLDALLSEIEKLESELTIDHYETPDYFDWSVEFAEVFEDGGFDVVLANPPYVRMELFKPIKPTLRRNFPSVHSDRADLYVYFFARAMQLLKKNGIGTFISSNKWLKAGYGEPLRQELLDAKKFHLVVDFGELPVFNAATFPAIFLWENSKRDVTPTNWTVVKDLEVCYAEGVREYILRLSESLPSTQFGKGMVRLAASSFALQRTQMEKTGPKLGDLLAGKILYGVKTGLNDAFFIDRQTKDRLSTSGQKNDEIIKSLLVGDNIRRYESHFRETYLIYTQHGIDISRYAGVEEYLRPFKKRLEARATNQEWFELQQPQFAYSKFFTEPKILYPIIGKRSRFTMDSGNHFINDKAFAFASNDYYLLAVLNSATVFEFLKKTCSILGDEDDGGRLEFRLIYLETLPIPSAADHDRKTIAGLAKETQNLHTTRRSKVEQFLLDIGTSAARSTSRNVLEQPWNLTEEEFLRRTNSRYDISIFRTVKEETMHLTTQTTKIEQEIDQRVADLYGVKLETERS